MNTKSTAFLPALMSVVVLLMTGIYLVLRFPFDTDYSVIAKVVLVSLSFINVPFWLYTSGKWEQRFDFYRFTVIAVLLMLGLVLFSGLLHLSVIVYPLSLLGLISFCISIYRYLGSVNYRAVMQLLFVVIFCMWLSGIVWEGRNLTPLFMEKVVAGFYNSPDLNYGLDNLFHMSMTQMIKTYNVVSTGLDELPYIPYHFGSHFIFAQFSRVLGVSVADMYHFGFPIILLPLFFYVLLLTFRQFRDLHGNGSEHDYFFWVFLLMVFIGVLPSHEEGIAFRTSLAWNSLIRSESYLVSMIFFLAAWSLVVIPVIRDGAIRRSWTYTGMCLLIIICIGFCKISSLFIFDIVLAYLFFRYRLYKSSYTVVLLFASAAVSLLIYYFLNDPKAPNGKIEFLSFYKNFINSGFAIYIILSLLWTFMLLGLWLFLFIRKIKVSSVFAELQLVIAIGGILPGMFINIVGGSAFYFSDIQHWTACVLIVPYLSLLFQNMPRVILRSGYVVGALIVIAGYFNALHVFERLWKDNYVTKNCLLGTTNYHPDNVRIREVIENRSKLFDKSLRSRLAGNPAWMKLNALSALDTLSRKEQKILFISEDTILSKYFQCYKSPFFVSAVTGISTFYGFSLKHCYWGDYGVEYYNREGKIDSANVCGMISDPVFKELVYVNMNEPSYRVTPCKK